MGGLWHCFTHINLIFLGLKIIEMRILHQVRTVGMWPAKGKGERMVEK